MVQVHTSKPCEKLGHKIRIGLAQGLANSQNRLAAIVRHCMVSCSDSLADQYWLEPVALKLTMWMHCNGSIAVRGLSREHHTWPPAICDCGSVLQQAAAFQATACASSTSTALLVFEIRLRYQLFDSRGICIGTEMFWITFSKEEAYEDDFFMISEPRP